MLRYNNLTQQEKYRFKIISLSLRRKLSTHHASLALDRSERQIRRIKVKVRILGIHGARHGLKGKPSNYRKSGFNREDISTLE